MSNKKGMTLSATVELIVIMVIAAGSLGLFISGMNSYYGTNVTNPFTGIESFNDSLSVYQSNASNLTYTSTPEAGGIMFQIINMWAILVGAFKLIFDFITAGWITDLLVMAFPLVPGISTIGLILRFFFVISLVFAIIRIIQRVQP